MTSVQNIWLTIFNFGPAIYLGIYKNWWAGIIALLAIFVLSWLLVFAISTKLPFKALTVWAWLKPPLVGLTILSAGLWLL